MANIVRILAGLGLLTLGRKLFWLFVAAIGFEFGFLLAERFLPPRVEPFAWVIALVIGIGAAFLAIFLQKLAIYVGGFIAGGSILISLLEILGIRVGPGADLFLLVVFVIGGIIGVILVAFIFEWALIVLSSLAGAALIARVAGPVGGFSELIVFGVLFIVGVIIQVALMQGEGK